jgi:hypothetical protein
MLAFCTRNFVNTKTLNACFLDTKARSLKDSKGKTLCLGGFVVYNVLLMQEV